VATQPYSTELPVEIILIPIETGHGTCVIAVVHDVRERRAAERRVADLGRAHLTLARMNQAIVRATDAQELYTETCRVAVEQGGYLGAWVSRSAPGRRVETLATAGRLDDYVAGLRITTDPEDPRGQGPTALALREGRAYFSADFLADVRTGPWHELASRHGIRASATVPLRCQGRVVAALTLWADEPHVFDEQMRALLEGMAENVSFALERFDAEEQLARVAAQRSDLLGRLVAAQEEERARIAADVHDDSVQALAAVDLRLGLLHRRVAEAAPELEAPVAQLQETVSAVVAGLRQLLFELEPAAEGTTLIEELREAAEHVLEGSGVRCRVEMASEAWPPQPPYDATRDPAWLPHEVRAQALRVAKEAFVNVRKHARATSVWVTVRPDPDGVEITVADDGVGVDPANLRSAPGHRGLATMRDRAEVAGGWCRIAGGPQGTHLTFWMPRNHAT
jgi:signal transduction histidine kinase